MLQSWMGGLSDFRATIPFAFADRGNAWDGTFSAAKDASMGRNEPGSVAEGLIAGSLVATDLGWLPVEDLRPGDRVVTFDHGMRPLKSVSVATLWTAAQEAPRAAWPLSIPARALGNRTEMQVLPEQALLIESDAAETLYGDAFTVVSAGALDGYRGITRVPPSREITTVTLEFDGDEVVYVNGTLLAHCPARQTETVRTAEELMAWGSHGTYQRLTDAQSRRLVAAMHAAG
ncbi:MAG: Hint domain-containing protein [Rhodobacter sp.]|nr:Hint domain-containing protein [Paracoccaceae bacterium]MCC0079581.1 Hint domain-containing protein [Rhodobacter sp.]